MITKIKKNKKGLYDVKFVIDSKEVIFNEEVELGLSGSFGKWQKIYNLKKKKSKTAYEFTLKNLNSGTYEYKYLFKNGNEIKWLEVETNENIYKDNICTNSEGTMNGFFII